MFIKSSQEYRERMMAIMKNKCSDKVKIQMLMGLVASLRQIYEKVHKKYADKEFPENDTTKDVLSTDQHILPQQICDLENNILMKRNIKIQLNEEIQQIEEELESLDQTVFVKQQLEDQMRRKIQFAKMKVEFQQGQLKMYKDSPKVSKNKTFSGFSQKIMNFFN